MPHYMQKPRCSRCGKGLWKKHARMIDGKVLCSACVFGQTPRDSDAMLGTKPAGLSPEGVAARAVGIAQPTPPENINGK